jgi:hypothetical protein
MTLADTAQRSRHATLRAALWRELRRGRRPTITEGVELDQTTRAVCLAEALAADPKADADVALRATRTADRMLRKLREGVPARPACDLYQQREEGRTSRQLAEFRRQIDTALAGGKPDA